MTEHEDRSEAPDSREEQPAREPRQDGTATTTRPAQPKPKVLPPWKVLLHNDDVNSFEDVIQTIVMLTPLNEQDAVQRTLEAHESGIALLLTTHQERAELYQQQFASRKLTVTIEPA